MQVNPQVGAIMGVELIGFDPANCHGTIPVAITSTAPAVPAGPAQ
jgi:hypothetical protein